MAAITGQTANPIAAAAASLSTVAEASHSAALQVFQSVVGETLAAQQGQITVLGQEVVLLRAQTAELREVHAAEVESKGAQATAREAELLARIAALQGKYNALLQKADEAPKWVAQHLASGGGGYLERAKGRGAAQIIRSTDWSAYRKDLREDKP